MHDDYRVTSELYRLMPPRKRAGPGDLGEAPDAARVTGPEPRARLVSPICAWTRPISSAVRAAQIRMSCPFKLASPGSSPHLADALPVTEEAVII